MLTNAEKNINSKCNVEPLIQIRIISLNKFHHLRKSLNVLLRNSNL